jgi:hypothetical protein
MKFVICIFIICLFGCKDPFESEMTCRDGILYIKDSGVWVEARLYKNNKCFNASEFKPTEKDEAK